MNNSKCISRLFKKRRVTPEGCWEWTGCIGASGYGNTSYLGSQWAVHRLAFFLLKREEWLYESQVNHTCNNKKCFNPDHLYIGNAFTNAIDAIKAGKGQAALNAQKTHCPKGHEYTSENIFLTKKGSRVCRVCKNESNRNYWRANESIL